MQISQKSKVNQPNQGHQPWQSNSLVRAPRLSLPHRCNSTFAAANCRRPDSACSTAAVRASFSDFNLACKYFDELLTC